MRHLVFGMPRMFEAGSSYRLRMWEPLEGGGGVKEFNARVTAVALPLIICKGIGATDKPFSKEQVINTSSLAFISATKIDESWFEKISERM